MDTIQANRVTMFKTVKAVLDENHSVWSEMAPFEAVVSQFKDTIDAIDAAAQKQEAPNGAADDKEEAREALEDVLFLTCEALGVLGHGISDHDLLALTAVRPSTLQRLTDEELSNRAASVLSEATSRKPGLATLQVTEANLTELEQALQDFNDSKANPRAATTGRMAQTQSLSALIRQGSGILRNQIDRMVSLFRRSDPDFAASYRGARVIVDRAASHRTTKAAGGSQQPTQ